MTSRTIRAYIADAIGGGLCPKHGEYFGRGKHGLRACPLCDSDAYFTKLTKAVKIEKFPSFGEIAKEEGDDWTSARKIWKTKVQKWRVETAKKLRERWDLCRTKDDLDKLLEEFLEAFEP